MQFSPFDFICDSINMTVPTFRLNNCHFQFLPVLSMGATLIVKNEQKLSHWGTAPCNEKLFPVVKMAGKHENVAIFHDILLCFVSTCM